MSSNGISTICLFLEIFNLEETRVEVLIIGSFKRLYIENVNHLNLLCTFHKFYKMFLKPVESKIILDII